MAKRNEITVGQRTQLSAQTAVRNNITARMRNGIRGRFTLSQATEAVLEAIKIEQNPNMTEEQIKEAKLLAVEIVSNSDAIEQRQIRRAVEVMQDNPPF